MSKNAGESDYDNEKNIKELIQELANDPAAEFYATACEVLEVDEQARTCDVKPFDGTAEIYGVRLQAIEGSEKGLVIVPTVGSGVLVCFISKSRAFVALGEQLDKILIDCDEVTFNGGDMGGIYDAPKTNIELNKLASVRGILQLHTHWNSSLRRITLHADASSLAKVDRLS